MTDYTKSTPWIDAHFDEQVKFLQELIRVPTDTPPATTRRTPSARRSSLQAFGYQAEQHVVPVDEVKAAGLESITNLIVRRRYGEGKTIAPERPWRRGATRRGLDA